MSFSPQEKAKEIFMEGKAINRRRQISLLILQQIVGKLPYIALGIPSGKWLLTPLHDTLRGTKNKIVITRNRHYFRDWRILFRLTTKPSTDDKSWLHEVHNLMVNMIRVNIVLEEYGKGVHIS